MDRRTTGLYHKFDVTRTDGTDAPGGEHDGCDYFVLDLTHDPHAAPAVRAYADSCRAEYPRLAEDLDVKAYRPDTTKGLVGGGFSGRREPTVADLADPRFDVIWNVIKHCGVVTGNDVCAVLDALDRHGVSQTGQ